VRGLQASTTDEEEEQILSWLQKKNEKITRKSVYQVDLASRIRRPAASPSF
jgi:hypothetical protein